MAPKQRDLYPPADVVDSGLLRLDSLHTMYWETAGNPAGQPAVFLHGGPGAGASSDHRRFFDPRHYRIIVYDQRGSGRSRPIAETRDNTTQHLIADMERLRAHLGVERWLVFGGSWGSTLALAYAQSHPERVTALVLRGVFLCRKSEVDWFLYGMRTIFPEAWERFSSFLPEAERGDLLAAYHARLMDPDPSVHLPAARAWSSYEGACSTLLPSPETIAAFGRDRMALSLARLEAHYFVNSVFLKKNALLDNTHRIAETPGHIVQGRYDIVCPIASAYDLHRRWPRARLSVIPDAGHSAMEPGVRRALIAATEDCKGME